MQVQRHTALITVPRDVCVLQIAVFAFCTSIVSVLWVGFEFFQELGRNPDALRVGWGKGDDNAYFYVIVLAACMSLAVLFLCISAASGLTSDPDILEQFPWAYAYQTNQRPYQDTFVENTVVYFGVGSVFCQSSDVTQDARMKEIYGMRIDGTSNDAFDYESIVNGDGPCTNMGLQGCITVGIISLGKRYFILFLSCSLLASCEACGDHHHNARVCSCTCASS